MEIKEAIKIIEKERDHCASHNGDFGKSAEYHKEMQDMVDAFDIAIKALKRVDCIYVKDECSFACGECGYCEAEEEGAE